MRLPLRAENEGENDPSLWGLLPGWCCQAAGGEARLADPVAAAWLLFYAAAHLMDSLEDQDNPDPWWADMGTGSAINVATGLYFSACLVLQELNSLAVDSQTIQAVTTQVLQPFLVMCSGQYQDLLHPPLTLAQYWRVASAKSGAFFAMACQAGARLATSRSEVLEGFQQFGLHLGLLLQILDDLQDYKELSESRRLANPRSLPRSLPAVYLREVGSAQAIKRFDQLLSQAHISPAAVDELTRIIEQAGGVLYLQVELNKHYDLALAGLDATGSPSNAREALVAAINWLHLPLS
jgi:geranylgeranyl pyrophosphate synthase